MADSNECAEWMSQNQQQLGGVTPGAVMPIAGGHQMIFSSGLEQFTGTMDQFGSTTTTGGNTLSWTTTNAPEPDPPQYYYKKFFRLNTKVELSERAIRNKDFPEPLDEMRLEVAQWLGKD